MPFWKRRGLVVSTSAMGAQTNTVQPDAVALQFTSVFSAPIPFLLAVSAAIALVWFIIWRIMESHYKGASDAKASQIETLKERIQLRDENLKELEKKLEGPAKIAVATTNSAIAQEDILVSGLIKPANLHIGADGVWRFVRNT